jgi:hypothetical protein
MLSFTPEMTEKYKLLTLPRVYKWDQECVVKYQNALALQPCAKAREEFMNKPFNENNVCNTDLAITDFNKMIYEAINIANIVPTRKSNSRNNKRKTLDRPWFNGSCHSSLLHIKSLKRAVKAKPYCQQTIQAFLRAKKDYKRTLKIANKNFYLDITKSLNQDSTSTELWSVLNRVKKYKSVRCVNSIAPKVWEEHFSKLMFRPPSSHTEEDQRVIDYIAKEQNILSFTELDILISETEVFKALKCLKNKKASGKDEIIAEMIKYGASFFTPALTRLFNLVFSSNNFPTLWSDSLISTIFKSGSLLLPSNYRGISVGSCISKLFCIVLHIRLKKFIKDNNLYTKLQIGFEEKCRTSDHILTLKTLIDKYRNQKKRLFACFVDFKQCFDTIWREGMLYKLLLNGVGGLFYRNIRSMYSNTVNYVKMSNGLSPPFPSNIGVKQGCVLSPTLFKLYVKDLPDVFDQSCHPVTLLSSKINCMMYADDTVLLSESAEGLQNCLNKLQEYCSTWHLEVNPKKTKIMVFKGGLKTVNTGVIPQMSYVYGNIKIEVTKEYPYLGIVFTDNGLFNAAIQCLKGKAEKSLFKLKHTFGCTNLSVSNQLRLFDQLITPILFYGCEVWGLFCPDFKRMLANFPHCNIFDKSPFELLHLKMARYILKVHNKATSMAVRAELGRFPLYFTILSRVLKYYNHLSDLTENSLIRETYLLNLDQTYNNGMWGNSLQQILNTLGVSCSTDSIDINRCLKKLRSNYTNIWDICLFNDVRRNQNYGNKLRTYRLFKNTFRKEQYLDLIKNVNFRSSLTKFRISAHSLQIEKGRHGKYIQENKRICHSCPDSIEDEMHVFFQCPSYSTIRTNLFNTLDAILPNLKDLCMEQQFTLLMSMPDDDVCSPLSKFIHEMFHTRLDLITKRTN